MKSKWQATEEDKKDCHRCRNGWPLIKNEGGFRAHSNGDSKELPCLAPGPLRLAPPAPRRDLKPILRRIVARFGYFLVGDAFLLVVVGLVWLALQGIHAVLTLLPGGWDQALSYARRGLVDGILGIVAIIGITQAGEYLWKIFRKPERQEESTT